MVSRVVQVEVHVDSESQTESSRDRDPTLTIIRHSEDKKWSGKFKASKASSAPALKCPMHGKINNRGSGVPTILLPLPNVVCFTSTVNNDDI